MKDNARDVFFTDIFLQFKLLKLLGSRYSSFGLDKKTAKQNFDKKRHLLLSLYPKHISAGVYNDSYNDAEYISLRNVNFRFNWDSIDAPLVHLGCFQMA